MKLQLVLKKLTKKEFKEVLMCRKLLGVVYTPQADYFEGDDGE